MPFTEHAALKAKSLKSCPGETRSTTSHTRPHAQRGNQCTAGRLAFSVFLTAVSGLKGEAAAFFVFPPLSHLEH